MNRILDVLLFSRLEEVLNLLVEVVRDVLVLRNENKVRISL